MIATMSGIRQPSRSGGMMEMLLKEKLLGQIVIYTQDYMVVLSPTLLMYSLK